MSRPLTSSVTKTFPIGAEVVAKYDFEGRKNRELAFSKGEILTIVKHANDAEWHHAKNSRGLTGIVPTNRLALRGVQLQAMPWFHGKISRDTADKILHPRENGLFLVRESNHFVGDYTLCVVYNGGVEHYRVKKDGRGMSVDDDIFFSNLIELVNHYSNDRDGLVCELQRPLEKQGRQEFCVDQKAFAESGWVIKDRELELLEELGRGEFGVVYKGKYKGQHVAIKTLKEAKNMETFLVEASSMTNLRHTNLVQLLGVKLKPLPIYIVTEFMDKGSLTDYLRSRGRAVVKQKDQFGFALDVSKAMVYLESKYVVHRDLAAQNVLLNEDNVAKVSDFGLSGRIEEIKEGGKFRVKWSAPEALKDNKPLNDVMSKVEKGFRMDRPDGCPDSIYNIMKKCWMINPDDRPSFERIQQLLKASNS